MAVNSPLEISYGGFPVGGTSDSYQLHAPYTFFRSPTTLRLVLNVVVVATSYSNLVSLSQALEVAFARRDQNLSISLDGSIWTFNAGNQYLNPTATAEKSGEIEIDKGYSRGYACTVEAELPADDAAGLRELEVNVDYESGRQRVVTMRGIYTSQGGTSASAQYVSDFGDETTGEALTILNSVDASATWELADENYSRDRLDAKCSFLQQHVELLADQSAGTRDDTEIRDHNISFTDSSQHPGDSLESTYRLRRVLGQYDCAIDVEQTTDLQTVYQDKVKDHIKELFRQTFSPQVFAIEEEQISYNESTKRLAATIQFLYQHEEGERIVEVSQSLAYREARTIDYTPVHTNDEYAAEADVGWATRERIWTRVVIVIGDERPQFRVAGKPKQFGPAGPFFAAIASEPDLKLDNPGAYAVKPSGWNIVSNNSQVEDQWVGDPGSDDLIKMSRLTETIVQRFNSAPTGGGTGSTGGTLSGGGIFRGPITGVQ